MKSYHIIIVLAFSLFACTSGGEDTSEDDFEIDKEAQREFFENVFNDDQLETEKFKIDTKRDTILVSESGCKFSIKANSFLIDGESVEGSVDIEIKEAFETIDFVLGNLTTNSTDGNLQTGGMIHVMAYSDGEELELKSDEYVGVIVPTDSLDLEMSIWEGEREDGIIEWEEEDVLQNQKVIADIRKWNQPWFYHPFEDSLIWYDFYDSNRFELDAWTYAAGRKGGDKIIVNGQEIKFSHWKEKSDTVKILNFGSANTYQVDYQTNYIFKISNLGWANIDRLYDDPRSEEVKLLAEVQNVRDFDFVYTSLVFKKEDMYLPGYQREDRTFGFTHYDSEKPILPIGAKAVMIFTAYQDGVPHYAVEEFEIEKEGSISVHLVEATMEGMKRNLESILG